MYFHFYFDSIVRWLVSDSPNLGLAETTSQQSLYFSLVTRYWEVKAMLGSSGRRPPDILLRLPIPASGDSLMRSNSKSVMGAFNEAWGKSLKLFCISHVSTVSMGAVIGLGSFTGIRSAVKLAGNVI